MDPGDVSSELDIDDWSVISAERPRCKVKSAPKPAPKYRFDLAVPRSNWVGHAPQPGTTGLVAPVHQFQQLDSVTPSLHSVGLAAPSSRLERPRSLQPVDSMDDFNPLASGVTQTAGATLELPRPTLPPGRSCLPRPKGLDAVVRTKQSSQSPVVQQLWTAIVMQLVPFSSLLQQLRDSPNMQQHLDRLLDTFAASTLVKYLTALGQFLQVCTDLRVDISSITEIQLADVLLACRLSKSSIKGMSHVSMLIKAVRWAHRTLQIESLSVSLGSMISSFQKGISADRRESLPFSLFMLMHFERRILMRESSEFEVIILGMCLFLAFSGLRFSDMQRTAPASLHWSPSTLRGTCWRTKTSRSGQPFGLIGSGFLSTGGYNWLFKFLQTLDGFFAMYGTGSEDYLVPDCDQDGLRIPAQPLSYAAALYLMRSVLDLPWRSQALGLGSKCQSYTIHGLKSTLLSWSHQLDLPEEHRRLQGKHRPQQSSTRLYSRDDVHGALRLQEAIVAAVRGGFRPSTPLARGGQAPMEEPQFKLQLFCKALPEVVEWRYFQFSAQEVIPGEMDAPLESDPQRDEVSSDSSESSSSSSDSSSREASPPKLMPDLSADEVTGALHRSMWHVALTSMGDNGYVIRTACGRRFPRASITILSDLQLERGQNLCSHLGCRKGWKAVGAL